MKTVGIIGGLSAESSILYYQGINDGVRTALGGHHAGRVLLNSLNFGEFVAYKQQNDWASQEKLLCQAAIDLQNGGADFVILATNTMHKMADAIEASISIPFLHLADTTADEIIRQGVDNIILLGTRYTMEMDFYKGRLEQKGITPLIPNEQERTDIHNIIYDELCCGVVKEGSKKRFIEIIHRLEKQSASGVILGCTEIAMLIGENDVACNVFDTTAIHIQAALEMIFEKGEGHCEVISG